MLGMFEKKRQNSVHASYDMLSEMFAVQKCIFGRYYYPIFQTCIADYIWYRQRAMYKTDNPETCILSNIERDAALGETGTRKQERRQAHDEPLNPL